MLTQKEIIQYACTSANLYNFLGRTDFEDHLSIFQQILRNCSNAHRDLMSFGAERLNIIDEHDQLDKMKNRAPIFVTFHTGSYYMLISLLLQRGVKHIILSDTASMGNQDYNRATSDYNKKYGNHGEAKMLNVEEDGFIFKMVRTLKQGYPAIAYLDGNKGIGGQTFDNENMLEVPFLKGRVRVRKGLPYIAFLAKVPLIPVLAYSKKGNDYLKIYDPIDIDCKDKEEYCVKAIDVIFRNFEEHVKRYPIQWGNWPYVHNWSDRAYFQRDLQASVSNPGSAWDKIWTFNKNRFCPLKYEKKFYLFDRVKYTMLPITSYDTSLFSYKISEEARNEIVKNMMLQDSRTIEDLISKKILIEA